MKTYLFLLLFVFQAFSLSSQISLKGYNQEKIDPSLSRDDGKPVGSPTRVRPRMYMGSIIFVNRSIWRWFLPGLSSMFPPITVINYM